MKSKELEVWWSEKWEAKNEKWTIKREGEGMNEKWAGMCIEKKWVSVDQCWDESKWVKEGPVEPMAIGQ